MRSFHTLHHPERYQALLLLSLLSLVVIFFVIAGGPFLNLQLFVIDFVYSFIRVCLSYVLALGLGLGIALLATVNPKVEELFIPILDVLQSFPSFSLFPLLLAFFGHGNVVTIIILVISMIWPIVFTVISGRKQLKADVLEAAQIFGAKGNKLYFSVLFPLLFPSVVTGSIIAWGEAWETIIAAEIIVNAMGMGSYFSGLPVTQPIYTVMGILLFMTILFFINKYFWLSLLKRSTLYQQE